jgi:hypothetical protein
MAYTTVEDSTLIKKAFDKKRRQGQGGAKPKDICPKCGEYLQSCYIRGSVEEKRNMKKIGLCCPSINCDYIVKDFVNIEDTEAEELQDSE